jgi:hypothetical protein
MHSEQTLHLAQLVEEAVVVEVDLAEKPPRLVAEGSKVGCSRVAECWPLVEEVCPYADPAAELAFGDPGISGAKARTLVLLVLVACRTSQAVVGLSCIWSLL